MRKLLIFPLMAFLFSCASTQVMPQKVSEKPLEVTPDIKAKPIYVPPTVVRVLVYPYEDDQGVLHQGEFLYFTEKDGYWTIATKGATLPAKKFVSIVKTQRGLDSRQSPVFYKPMPRISPKTPVPSEKPKPQKRNNLKNDKRVQTLEQYLREKNGQRSCPSLQRGKNCRGSR